MAVYLPPLIRLMLWIKWHSCYVVVLLMSPVRRNQRNFTIPSYHARERLRLERHIVATESNKIFLKCKNIRDYSKLAWDLSLFLHINLLIFLRPQLVCNVKWLAEQEFNLKLNEAVNREGKASYIDSADMKSIPQFMNAWAHCITHVAYLFSRKLNY